MSYDEAFSKGKSPAAPRKPHSLSLENRERLSISGVEEVESFDEQEIVLRTSLGGLVISGEALTVSRLSVDSGDVSVGGKIAELRYEDQATDGRSLWSRLFR